MSASCLEFSKRMTTPNESPADLYERQIDEAMAGIPPAKEYDSLEEVIINEPLAALLIQYGGSPEACIIAMANALAEVRLRCQRLRVLAGLCRSCGQSADYLDGGQCRGCLEYTPTVEDEGPNPNSSETQRLKSREKG